MNESFAALGLSEQSLSAVDALGYTDPTPVQQKAIPAVLSGSDVIAAAKTGTGKTAAFSLPSMSGLGHAQHGQGPLMLVVTPTRELAMQIEEVCRTIAKSTHHQVTCVVGGVSYDPQIKQLKRGCDVLIATPGRLMDLMERRCAKLSQVETLVLDEADRMLDMGFLPAMKKIVAATPKNRQTLLFSATIDDGITKNMGFLLKKDPVYVEIAHKGETADTVEQYVMTVEHRLKANLLIALLKEHGSKRVIVFARTRHRADACCRKLRRAGFSAEPIHSDRSQNQRKRSLDNFASGRTDILVATDVLARGIDVSEVNYVVNFDLPSQSEDYVHRIGRTGRAGAEGFAVSFVTDETRDNLKDIQKLIGRTIPTMEVAGFDATESEAAQAARATRKAAKNDPELADAAREFKKTQRKKKKKRAATVDEKHGGEEGRKNKQPQQPQKTRGTAKKQRKKNQRSAGGPAAGNSKRSNNRKGGKRDDNPNHIVTATGVSPKNDFRPGRAHRAGK